MLPRVNSALVKFITPIARVSMANPSILDNQDLTRQQKNVKKEQQQEEQARQDPQREPLDQENKPNISAQAPSDPLKQEPGLARQESAPPPHPLIQLFMFFQEQTQKTFNKEGHQIYSKVRMGEIKKAHRGVMLDKNLGEK